MAFALALQSTHDIPESHGRTIFSATTAIVVLTVCSGYICVADIIFTAFNMLLIVIIGCQVLLIGGSTSTMLEVLDVIGENNTNGNIEVC